jgi:Tfp pilus assembly protein PilO
MSATEPGDRRSGGLKARLLESLHNPTQLRVCVIAAVLLAGYYAAFVPLDARIDATTKKLARETKLIKLAANLERLQKQYAAVEPRVPRQVDTKQWVQYVLDGIRRLPLKMNKLDCRPPKQLGPLTVFTFQIDLEGTFYDLDKFLRWVESDQRLLRVDDVLISPIQSSKGPMASMRLTLLGLSG